MVRINLFFIFCFFCQFLIKGQNKDSISKKFNLDAYLRANFELSDFNHSSFKLQDARIDIRGNGNKNIDYRIRFKLNRNFSPQSQDNGSLGLDYAYIDYKFGKNLQWKATIGKQLNNLGSFEYSENPIYEFQYSDVIRQQNIFTLGAQLSHQITENQSIHAQITNTSNISFSDLATQNNYQINHLTPSKYPFNTSLLFKSYFFSKKIQGLYSIGTSKIVENKPNYIFFVGHKLNLKNFNFYIDFHHSKNGLDHHNIISKIINNHQKESNATHQNIFAENLIFQSLAFKMNYSFAPKWNLMIKNSFEQIHDKNSLNLGNHLRKYNIHILSIDFKPFENQDFKIFTFYTHLNDQYKKNLQNSQIFNQNKNLFGIGLLWYLNAIKYEYF